MFWFLWLRFATQGKNIIQEGRIISRAPPQTKLRKGMEIRYNYISKGWKFWKYGDLDLIHLNHRICFPIHIAKPDSVMQNKKHCSHGLNLRVWCIVSSSPVSPCFHTFGFDHHRLCQEVCAAPLWMCPFLYEIMQHISCSALTVGSATGTTADSPPRIIW